MTEPNDLAAALSARFVDIVLSNDINRVVLERGHLLGVPDWWLTAGALSQTVWNSLSGRPPGEGIRDYDLFYFDPTDTSFEAEDAVVRRAADLFADTGAVVEVRNEARVHLWYEEKFGVPAAPFTSTRDAIDHFAATTCCHALTRDEHGALHAYAPHGYDDLFALRLRPNPVLAPREVYETKADRWAQQWPELHIEPWPDLAP
ncbi:nucleotidyltransferase family protein [Pseudokineococcus basanitobsidens]|uniref:Nucleotidyltransferase family protein n=1 Tax=Pseudokineococcus basanitobsidens TaxID=1926649 RepID=A0ABU8RPQ3_9ACTN